MGVNVFIGAKVHDHDEDVLGFVYSHDGCYEGGAPWRVAELSNLGRYTFANEGDLRILGDFGECPESSDATEHPLWWVWRGSWQEYAWGDFRDRYNAVYGRVQSELAGGDSMEGLERD